MKRSSKLPIQAAPVTRNITGAAMSNGNGVDPSSVWDLVKTYGPGIVKGIKGIKGISTLL